MATSEFFSGNYQQARSKFLEAARGTRAEISSHRLLNYQEPDGSDLFVDVASLRSKRQHNVLIVISLQHLFNRSSDYKQARSTAPLSIVALERVRIRLPIGLIGIGAQPVSEPPHDGPLRSH